MRPWIFSALICCSCVADPSARAPVTAPAAGFAPVAGGAIHYDVTGRGRPMVLLHGGGLDLRMWDAVLPRLSSAGRILRWDAPGHGASTAPGRPTADTAEDLRGLLDHLQIDRATLMGFSMGAGTAAGFAIRYPGRVRQLVLISTSGPPPGAPRSAAGTPPLADPEGRRLLAAARVPVLMIVGSRDSERIRATADAVIRDVKGARLIVIEGGSHNVIADRPEETASAILAFVRDGHR